MKRLSLNRIKDLSPRGLLLISVLASVIMTTVITSLMSLIFHRRITPDYLITGFITSSLVAAVIVHIILTLTREIKATEMALRVSNEELSSALREIRYLHGILPVCSHCKRIKNEDGQWEEMEAYITDRSEADFSHGICPECAGRLYADEYGTETPEMKE